MRCASLDFPVAPLVLALVIGPMLEDSFRQIADDVLDRRSSHPARQSVVQGSVSHRGRAGDGAVCVAARERATSNREIETGHPAAASTTSSITDSASFSICIVRFRMAFVVSIASRRTGAILVDAVIPGAGHLECGFGVLRVQLYLPVADLPVNVFLILAIGLAVGFISGLFGVGGGFLMTPLLIFIGIAPRGRSRDRVDAHRRVVVFRRSLLLGGGARSTRSSLCCYSPAGSSVRRRACLPSRFCVPSVSST